MKPISVPDSPTLDGLEDRWDRAWETDGTYRFDRTKTRDEIYSVDTPPPTASGMLHGGSACSYTQTDLQVRYWRMRGKEIFYPMGWDDNGLPTERRVQNYFGVKCDSTLQYVTGFEPPRQGEGDSSDLVAVSRRNFIELCHELVGADELEFERVFRRLGLSVDWTINYKTIGKEATRVSQISFLRLLKRGVAYAAESPVIWDSTFGSAVAQAELEDREIEGAMHRIEFQLREVAGGTSHVEIETTRPELIASCVALVAHPDDGRYKPLAGRDALTPLFSAPVPIVLHPLAHPEKGTGLAMICTFGDMTDVTWWRDLKLPTRALIQRDGTFAPHEWDTAAAQKVYDLIAGLRVRKARSKMVELLTEAGVLKEVKPIRHAVKFFEKGDYPVEIVSSRQWFFKTLDITDEILARGAAMKWWPSFMKARFDDWTRGLNTDWLVSRQRPFGVPFPIWYRLDGDGNTIYEDLLIPDETMLPVDPADDAPHGFEESQRGKPGGFIGDLDVMDTWATSSLTPQIASGWERDEDLHKRVFPMDLRPQAHDIIRTWLFSTVVRSHYEHGELPFYNAAISGWITDPDRKKMSKSKGSVETPMAFLERYGSDGFRYWAANRKLGYDAALDVAQMQIGRRLATKILNASKFVLGRIGDESTPSNPLDLSMLANLAIVVREATAAFEEYEFGLALDQTERFFWTFCDDYVELIKTRSYGSLGEQGAASASAASSTALNVLLRLFAPILPYVTEEVWSWWQEGSIHRASWPMAAEIPAGGETGVLYKIALALGDVRRAKTQARLSLKVRVDTLTIEDSAEGLRLIDAAREDLIHAGNIADLVLREGPEFKTKVDLAAQTN